MEKNFKEALKSVRLLAFDIDGVLTDGHVTFIDSGQTSRTYYARDGHALELAVKNQLQLAIVSKAHSEDIRIRFQRLGIQDIRIGVTDKLDTVKELAAMYDLDSSEILFMGDDLPDMEVMRWCGVAACPDNADPAVRMICQYVSPYAGGKGCVRDVIEQVLKVQGKW